MLQVLQLAGFLTQTARKKKTGSENNKKTHNPVWGFIQDIGYGIADIFGQGETADRAVNWVDKNFFGGVEHKNSTTLISELSEKFGIPVSRARNLITRIDNKMNELDRYIAQTDNETLNADLHAANLPPALSSNLKKIVVKRRADLNSQKINNERKKIDYQKQKEDLAANRNKVATDLTKVENSMNVAQNLAQQQDMLKPSRKAENQTQISEMVNDQPNLSYLEDIERSLK